MGLTPVWAAGLALASGLAGAVAYRVSGPRAAGWTGALVLLTPILVLACQGASPSVPLLLLLLALLWLLLECDASGRRAAAVVAGPAAGALVASGVMAFAAAATLCVAWLALDARRRRQAGLAAALALAVVAALALAGYARSPLDYGPYAASLPRTTLESLLRCSGASFTRLLGLEYHFAFPQARHVLPLTLVLVALMVRGARDVPPRTRGLLAAGALAPFSLAAAIAATTGTVAPMQADRLLAALPFTTLLLGTGIESIPGRARWAVGLVVVAPLVFFLALAPR